MGGQLKVGPLRRGTAGVSPTTGESQTCLSRTLLGTEIHRQIDNIHISHAGKNRHWSSE